MASLTRRSIMDSFIRLLEERPVNKISVKDVVEDCGINRNTFYYHFADIPALVEEIVRANPASVVIADEAYVDFGAESALPLTFKYDNLLVVQTFSKSRSLAGARLGFGIACAPLIEDLKTLKYSTNPYNVNSMTQRAGCAALDEPETFEKNCKAIIRNREYLTKKLSGLGFVLTGSSANFVFAKHPAIPGEYLYLELKARGVLIRHFTADRIKDFNRITVGSTEQIDILIEKTKEILGGLK